MGLKVYPHVDGVSRGDATDNESVIESWVKKYGDRNWVLPTGPDLRITVLEAGTSGQDTIKSLMKTGQLPASDDELETLWASTPDGRSLIFFDYPQDKHAKERVIVKFQEKHVSFYVEEGSVLLPTETTLHGTDNLAKCPDWLTEAAFEND